MEKAHIGLSGWSYREWKGAFYPVHLKPTEWLSFYAQTFDTVEVNSSFYHSPKVQTLQNWAERVPSNFVFCPKMSSYVTHLRKLQDCEEPLQRFFGLFEPLREKLGPILIQLPPSLKFDYAVADAFFALVQQLNKGFSFALEARHATWVDDNAFNLLAKYEVAWVVSQSGVGFPYSETVTAKNVYVRFHGPEKLYFSAYSETQLQYFADKLSGWMHEGHTVWVYFNNTAAGHALENAQELKVMVSARLGSGKASRE